jgi:hypothetical protein
MQPSASQWPRRPIARIGGGLGYDDYDDRSAVASWYRP